MITRAGPGVATSGVIGIKRNSKASSNQGAGTSTSNRGSRTMFMRKSASPGQQNSGNYRKNQSANAGPAA